MATKKAAEKAVPTLAAKITKTQIVKALAEKLDAEPKQVQSFFDALVEMETEQTRESGEFTVPGLGKLVKAERKERMGRNPATGADQDRREDHGEVPYRKGRDRRDRSSERLMVVSNVRYLQ